MKGQKAQRQTVRWQILPLLLASAALGFAQVSGVPAPGAWGQGPNVNGPAAPQEPVGPGTINYVEGQASINRQAITPHSIGTAALKPGQVLDTGAGYVEVLLTPGAFLRVGNNSELRMMSAGLADTTTELVRGASILEVDQIIKGTHLAVQMNGTMTQIEKKGLYDFNSAQQAVMVLDGKARIQEPAGSQTLSKHDEVLLSSRRPLKKRNFDEKNVQVDPLYVWSKARSEDEAQASASAASNASAYQVAGAGWYWDPAWDFYGFWPAEDALYSPFGWGFYSPGFFGFGYGYGGGYYGGGYYGGRRFDHDGDGRADWAARRGWAGRQGFAGGGLHGRVGGMNARVGGFHGGGFSHVGGGGFHGGGFHGGGGGAFHGGGGGHR